MANEYKAGQHNVDVIEGSDTVSTLKEQGLLQSFASPQLAQLPADFRDKDGMWGGLYSTWIQGYFFWKASCSGRTS